MNKDFEAMLWAGRMAQLDVSHPYYITQKQIADKAFSLALDRVKNSKTDFTKLLRVRRHMIQEPYLTGRLAGNRVHYTWRESCNS